MGALAVVGQVLAFIWENRQTGIDMYHLVEKALGLTEASTPEEVATVASELAAARARRQANNERIEDTSRG